MECECLRNCFVDNQYYQIGKLYVIPESMKEPSPKNFRLGEQEQVQENVQMVEAFAVKPTEASREPNPGEYFCNKCQSNHRKNSKLGKRHLKHIKNK